MAVHNIFNLAGPPRSVPLSVRLRVLFGGVLNQAGWFFFGFGLAFVWAFTLNADLTSWYRFRGQLDTTEGKVIGSKKTLFSKGGSSHYKDTHVYAIHYAFTAADGKEYKGLSYITGKQFEQGQKVTIEYPQGKPQTSRIKGMRQKPVGFFGIFPVLFPLIGLLLITGGIRKGLKANQLLALGEQTTGRLKSKEKTNKQVDKEPVYKLTFEFNTPEGMTFETVVKTHETGKLEDQAEEPLLYDPMRPSYAMMLDDLPGNPRIMENGTIQAGSVAMTIMALIIPLTTIIGHSIYIVLKFLS
ncbi:MAG: DUF3592 domain-containing protein [Planctomycetota bacterium]|jgi:hypothetical protein